MFKLQLHKLQVCENNWIRIIASIKRLGRRKLKEEKKVELRLV